MAPQLFHFYLLLIALQIITSDSAPTCTAITGSCSSATSPNPIVTCTANSQCDIECLGSGATDCNDKTIFCDTASTCTISCKGTSACYESTINASRAKHLTVTVSSGTTTAVSAAQYASVYCPQKQLQAGGNVSCMIESTDASWASQFATLAVYAMQGFTDVAISCDASSCASPGGIKLFCGENEDLECSVGDQLARLVHAVQRGVSDRQSVRKLSVAHTCSFHHVPVSQS